MGKKIVSRFEFNIDKKILILSTNNYNGTVTLNAFGEEKDLIENVYYKIRDNDEFNEFNDTNILTKKDDFYILNSISIPGNYEFSFSYFNSKEKFNKIYVELKV